MASRNAKGALALGAATLAGSLYWRLNPSPCPFGQRWVLQLPRPVITRRRLMEILGPQPGERILEIGPGTGYYTLPVAQMLGPAGKLAVFDIQQRMLDLVMKRASKSGITNIEPTLGSAEKLPYTFDSFDAAYLVTVLGEVPNRQAALAELKRVVRPGGRIVVGEMFGDPHMVTLKALRQQALKYKLALENVIGGNLGYFSLLRVPS